MIVGIICFFLFSIKLSVIPVYDDGMAPALEKGQFLIVVKGGEIQKGDLVAISLGGNWIVKRLVGESLDEIDIQNDGTVLINKEELEENYVLEKNLGETDLTYPYQVPAYRYFVMGDNREVSYDSRNSHFGCVAQEQIAGRVALCIWPLNKFGPIE